MEKSNHPWKAESKELFGKLKTWRQKMAWNRIERKTLDARVVTLRYLGLENTWV